MEEAGAHRLLVKPRGVVGERLLERADDGQLLVVDLDRMNRGLGRRLGLGGDRRDGLAREADAVERKQRPVLQRVAVVRVDAAQVAARHHADDARDRLCRGGFDPGDARVRQL